MDENFTCAMGKANRIQPYWQDLAGEIQSICGLKVNFSFITLYLGKTPVGLTAQDNYLYKVLLAASKKAITRKWLQPNLPTRNDWISIVIEIQCMEKLTFTLRLRAECYWERWTSYSFKCNSLSVWIIPPFYNNVWPMSACLLLNSLSILVSLFSLGFLLLCLVLMFGKITENLIKRKFHRKG